MPAVARCLKSRLQSATLCPETCFPFAALLSHSLWPGTPWRGALSQPLIWEQKVSFPQPVESICPREGIGVFFCHDAEHSRSPEPPRLWQGFCPPVPVPWEGRVLTGRALSFFLCVPSAQIWETGSKQPGFSMSLVRNGAWRSDQRGSHLGRGVLHPCCVQGKSVPHRGHCSGAGDSLMPQLSLAWADPASPCLVNRGQSTRQVWFGTGPGSPRDGCGLCSHPGRAWESKPGCLLSGCWNAVDGEDAPCRDTPSRRGPARPRLLL